VWTDNEYQFMQENREAWPNGCTKTMFMVKQQGGSGTPIYYPCHTVSLVLVCTWTRRV
jgi:hypothetical protein